MPTSDPSTAPTDTVPGAPPVPRSAPPQGPAPVSTDTPTGPLGSVPAPDNPARPGTPLLPFRAALTPPRAHHLPPDAIQDVVMAAARQQIHPDLPDVPVWGFGIAGHVTAPGPLLEVPAGSRSIIRWRNRLPASRYPLDPGRPVPQLPFATAKVEDPNDQDSVQNELGSQGGAPQDLGGAPVGWTTVHLHGAHDRSDSDGWPDNMVPVGGEQLADYENSYDNLDLGLRKVGAFLWYHDHAMNGTRFHVYAGLAGGYLVRDPSEHQLGLPTGADDGEVVLMVQDRNIDVVGDRAQFLHKTTPDTGEFFGPLTLVNGHVWPRLALRPEVYRLRILNASNARAYRLHLVAVRPGADGAPAEVTAQHARIRIIGTDGGLLWRAAPLGDDDGLTLAPAERIDVLVDLSGLPDGTQLHLVNSAPAPFGGDPVPALADLWKDGDLPGRNRFPWVMRLDVDSRAPHPGRPKEVFDRIATGGAPLNPAFRRLVHDLTEPQPPDAPRELTIADHMHHVVLLAEQPVGHLWLQELVEDKAGHIKLQLAADQPVKSYRVNGWVNADHRKTGTRVSFYDVVGIRPQLGQWQLFTFVNTTGDTHPMHIHQSTFQPLGAQAGRIRIQTADGNDRYDALTRTTVEPLEPETDPAQQGRRYEPQELLGWKEVIRVDPGNVVKVAIRFDIPGRYVYHCHVVEHEDTEMMRPIVVSVLPMADGMPMHM